MDSPINITLGNDIRCTPVCDKNVEYNVRLCSKILNNLFKKPRSDLGNPFLGEIDYRQNLTDWENLLKI